MQNQKAAVGSAQWLLYRYNPDRAALGENPLQLDAAPPRMKVSDYYKLENRFRMLDKIDPTAAMLLDAKDASARRDFTNISPPENRNRTRAHEPNDHLSRT